MCGLTPEEFDRVFPKITYPLDKQCLCGARLAFCAQPGYCWKCKTFTHPAYFRPIEELYKDQMVKDVHANHAPIDLIGPLRRGFYPPKRLDGPK